MCPGDVPRLYVRSVIWSRLCGVPSPAACFPSGNRLDISFLNVYGRFCGVWSFLCVFYRVFCSVRSAASVRQIDGVPLSCACLGAVHGLRCDALQPAGSAETVTADICAAGRRKSRHTAQIAQIDGIKIARIAPGFGYLCFPASDDRTEKIKMSGNNSCIVTPPFLRMQEVHM